MGVPELTTVSTHSDSLQAQALDRNFEFAHFIQNSSKPEDMSDELWAAGFECTHNILAMGYTPQGAITGWMNEGYSLSNEKWDTLGHRYALIGADHSNIQFGYSGRVAIGKNVSDQSDFQTPFTAFPAPGYMPTNLVSPSESAWSVELNEAVIRNTHESAVKVTVTNLATGDSYQCTKGDDTLFFDAERIGFVQPSTSGHYTGSYSVEITGLIDVATGNEAVIRYTTHFVDINDIADSCITDVTSGISSYVISQTIADQLDKILPILPQEVTVTAESGKQVTVPVAGAWTIDETNKCFVNSVAESALPSNLTDPNNILNRVTIPYVLSADPVDSYNSLSISPDTVSPGKTVTFKVYRARTSTDTSQIFKLTQNQDGSYSAVKKLDSATSVEFDAEDSRDDYPNHVYYCQATANDSGEYLSVYFNSSWMQNGQTEVYVSTSTPTLIVTTCQHQAGEPVKENEVAPTCTEEGSYEDVVYCTLCGEEISRQTVSVPALGHAYQEDVKAPTCTEKGYTTYTCSRCGDTYTVTVDKVDHAPSPAFNENYVDPTCTEEGSYEEVIICTICGTEISRQKVSVPALGHAYQEDVKAPTCTEMGYTTYTCSRCGDTYKGNYTDAAGHKPSDWIIDREPTTSSKGSKHKECTVCGELLETAEIEKIHTGADGQITVPDTAGKTNEDGITTVGWKDKNGDRWTITVKVVDHETGRPIAGAKASIDKDGNITITLPDGTDMDEDNRITVTITDQKREPREGLTIIIKCGLGRKETGETDEDGKLTVPAVVESEYHGAYVTGYTDGTFGPDRDMTRSEAATIFARLLAQRNGERITAPVTSTFQDVSADAWYAGYVSYLARYGIAAGYTDGLFHGDESITRAEFTAMAVRFFDAYGDGDPAIMEEYGGFGDVSPDHWAAGYIEDAARYGWVVGYGDGTFHAEDEITRAEVVTIVNRLLGREADQEYIADNPRGLILFPDVSKDYWAYYDILEAANGHMAPMEDAETGLKA